MLFSATSPDTWEAKLHAQHATGLGFASIAFVLDCVITVTVCSLLYRVKTEYTQYVRF
jgi:hypothetical protein